MDFTIKKYISLLESLVAGGYRFITFQDYFSAKDDRFIILRHDVDDKKLNSLKFAEIQNRMGIRGTYYFRMVPQSYDPEVISRIASLGHEIGYHYEDMDIANSKLKNQNVKSSEEDLYDPAFHLFKEHLALLRELYPVKTICMHGSPRSGYDNKALWKKYDYKELEITGEPYFDLDFNQVFYLTDTGRRWDGDKVSVRDKVELPSHFRHLSFSSTPQIIHAVEQNRLPGKVMFTFHPQRWTDDKVAWASEFIMQNVKNTIKRYFFVKQSHNAGS
jgi:hypothetical protein